MSAIRSTNTKAELELRRQLTGLGLRYRLHVKDLPGRPDVVFASKRVAIFCDGDYWHGRNWTARKQKLLHGVRAQYWIRKIEGNRSRDRKNSRTLRRGGWLVLRYWETDVLKQGESIARHIAEVLRTHVPV